MQSLKKFSIIVLVKQPKFRFWIYFSARQLSPLNSEQPKITDIHELPLPLPISIQSFMLIQSVVIEISNLLGFLFRLSCDLHLRSKVTRNDAYLQCPQQVISTQSLKKLDTIVFEKALTLRFCTNVSGHQLSPLEREITEQN